MPGDQKDASSRSSRPEQSRVSRFLNPKAGSESRRCDGQDFPTTLPFPDVEALLMTGLKWRNSYLPDPLVARLELPSYFISNLSLSFSFNLDHSFLLSHYYHHHHTTKNVQSKQSNFWPRQNPAALLQFKNNGVMASSMRQWGNMLWDGAAQNILGSSHECVEWEKAPSKQTHKFPSSSPIATTREIDITEIQRFFFIKAQNDLSRSQE